MLKANKIEFISPDFEHFFEKPTLAKQSVPEWYKKMPRTFDGQIQGLTTSGNVNGTVKTCIPFIDAMSFGYMVTLQADVEVKIDKEKNTLNVFWAVPGHPIVTEHDIAQVSKEAFNENYYSLPFKWENVFKIKTPKGYSCLFTHPLNQEHLPFKTFSGVVDTDTYPLSVNFPFVFAKTNQDTFIIEKGTPICQIIPFKREQWKNNKTDETFDSKKGTFTLKSILQNSYKKTWWVKKDFS